MKFFSRRLAITLTVLTSVAAAISSPAFELPLHAVETGKAAGPRFITIGVPLLQGQAKETAELSLASRNANGALTPIPAQFRVLARWWRADNSIRWVLVDCAATMNAGQTNTFFLTNAKLPPAVLNPAMKAEESVDAITIITGPAKFVVSKKKFVLLDSAVIDANADGKFADDEDLLSSSPDLGTVIEDTYGDKYYGSESVKKVEILENGPMRVRIRAQGQHKARDGKGYSRGMYYYDCFLDFYAGSTEVFTDVIIANNPPKSMGSPTFEDASLLLKLKGAGFDYAFTGENSHAGRIDKSQSACLYQDSNGADTWDACPGFGNMDSPGWSYPKGTVTSFRGFRLSQRAEGKEPRELAAGNHARGLVHLFNDKGGLIVNTQKFWQQFPKAVEIAGDGTIRIGLFPRECKVPHFIEDASAKGHEIVFSFYAGKSVLPYAADSAGRPQPAAVADAWDSRVCPRPPIEHMAAAGALADLGPYTVPAQELDKKPDTRTGIADARMLTADQLYGNAYGWQVFGDRWRSNGGHGKRGARQPIDEDNYLYRWYLTGLPQWFASGYARSRHFRDVRMYRIDDQDPFSFKDWAAFKVANMNEDWTKRPQPKDEEYEKYTQGIWKRSNWLFPNPEHTTLDLLYDRYLLFGDVRCLENMRIAAAHGGYFAGRGGTPLRDAWPWRANGWGWRALERYWDLTGDKDAYACLQDVIKTHSAFIGKAPLHSLADPTKKEKVHWWFTSIYCRAVAMTALHTGDPQMLELCKTLAQGKEDKANKVPTLFAVLHHLTGNEEYKKNVLDTAKPEELLRVGGYYPACDHWLLNQPPAAKKTQEAQ